MEFSKKIHISNAIKISTEARSLVNSSNFIVNVDVNNKQNMRIKCFWSDQN